MRQPPLTRFHHRIKTHGRWRQRQPGPGIWLWRSPHGHYFQVDATGTHPLTRQAGEAYWDALASPRSSDPPRVVELELGLPIRVEYDVQHIA